MVIHKKASSVFEEAFKINLLKSENKILIYYYKIL
jgi:hypothetical protein